MGWPITKAVANLEAETVPDFLVQQKFMYYGLPKELLSDYVTSLLANVIEYYLQNLYTQYKYTTTYYCKLTKRLRTLTIS